MRPNGYDSCEQIKSYFACYTVPEAALLWCGVPEDELEGHLEYATPIGNNSEYAKSILKQPYIPCLEPRCRAIQDAIDKGKLKVGRDGSDTYFTTDSGHVAYSKRTLKREDLREWIANEFPNDKPAFLFDEIERAIHPSITIEAYQALKADRDALKTRIDKAIDSYRELQKENVNLKAALKKPELSEKEHETYQNIIGGLLTLLLGNTPAGKAQSVFNNQTAIIDALLARFENKQGIKQRTLEEKFADANKSIKS